MDTILSDVISRIPEEINLPVILRFIALCAAGALVMGFINRFILGKRSQLNHAVSSAMGILFIYVLTVAIYSVNPWNFARFLPPLPFVTFYGERMTVFSFRGAELSAVCEHVLSLLILAFLVNLLDSFIPKGEKIGPWYLYRLLTVAISMALHGVVSWLSTSYIPGFLITYAPMILLGVLGALLLLGASKVVLGLILTAVNPIIGGIYAFFFSHDVGKQLTKAVVTTAILCVLVFLIDHFGYSVISVSAAALVAYIPLILILLVLWYILGHVL